MYASLPPPHLANAAQTADVNNHTEDASALEPGAIPPSDQAEPSEYQYGITQSAPRDSNFISDSDLLVWLAQRQDGMYADLREIMDISRERSKLIQDLGQIKSLVDGNADLETVRAEMALMLERYAGTEYQAQIAEAFLAFNVPYVAQMDTFGETERSALAQDIQGLMDALGRDDQLALIRIQSLTSDIREVAQLVSNLMSSSAQAAGTIVGNLRA